MSLLDRPVTPEAAAWAARLVLLRVEPPADLDRSATTLRNWRNRLLDAATDPDESVASARVTREDVVWAYRIYIGREPESETAVAHWLGLPSLAELSRLIRETPEFQAQRAAGNEPGGVTLAGEPAIFSGEPDDLYFQSIRNAAELALPFERVVSAVARTRPGSIDAIDIGANLGVTSVVMARLLPRSRLLSVEPGPKIARHLRTNLERNGAARAEVVEAAIGRRNGTASFNLHAFAAGSHLLAAGEEEKANHSVELITLDRLCESRGIADLGLVKIDVEGFERDVLEGGLTALHRMRPVVIIEFNAWAQLGISDTNPRHFMEWLLAEFPCVFSLAPDGTTWERLEGWQALQTLHRNLVERHCIEDLVLSWDESWLAGLA